MNQEKQKTEITLIVIKKKLITWLKFINPEVFVWLGALIYLAIIPAQTSSHFTICPVSNLGFDWCPGCGLGNSISFLFKGKILESFYQHPLGLPAVLILSARIYQLFKQSIRKNKFISITNRG